MIIAIDFDGTIVEDEFPKIGKLKPGAKEAIDSMMRMGHHVIIWTCRNDRHALSARRFLAVNGIAYHGFNESNPANVAKYGSDTRKVYADLYIDDKAINGLPEWKEILQLVITKSDKMVDKIIREGHL